MRCRQCGAHLAVPHHKNATPAMPRHNNVQVQPNDHLSQAHNSICHATRRIKDMFHRSPSNTMEETGNSYGGSGNSSFGHYPELGRPSASVVPISAHGPKRALLCGVSYYGQRYRLQGSVNDVKCMRYFLTQKFGFPSDSILVLTEEESNPHLIPTKNNIRKALRWLVQGCKSGDSLVFYYSGHGSQQTEFNRDEVDGHDEILWPVDHQTKGAIVDDEINATIVRPLTEGVKLHAIVDACHSGTILDLPFVCRINRDGYYLWEDQGSQSSIYKGTSGGLAISFSSCDDHQISVDTTALSGNTATGAMTYSFIQAVQDEPGVTYGRLVNAMRRKIRDVQKGFVASLVRKVLTPELTQEPQLSSTERFDIYSRKFALQHS